MKKNQFFKRFEFLKSPLWIIIILLIWISIKLTVLHETMDNTYSAIQNMPEPNIPYYGEELKEITNRLDKMKSELKDIEWKLDSVESTVETISGNLSW